MHEVSLVADLVERVRVLSREQSFERVVKIRLSVGALSGVEADCLEFCFPEVCRGSALEGAELQIESIPLEVVCRACGALSSPEDPAVISCSVCQSSDVEIRRGRDFKIVDLEVI